MSSTFGVPEDPYPSGTILMWSRPLSEIPDGWVICDGNNGTPNLLDEFPRSVPDTSTNPGGTGGTHGISLSSSHLPEHKHTLSVDNGGSHDHGFEAEYRGSGSTHRIEGYDTNYNAMTSTGDHSHTTNISNTGSASSIDNRQKFVELAFIQKL